MKLPTYMTEKVGRGSEEYWFFRKWDESGLAVALAGVDVKRFQNTESSHQLQIAIGGEDRILYAMMDSWREEEAGAGASGFPTTPDDVADGLEF